MSYLLRKNYFKDYFWEVPGDHAYWDVDAGVPAIVPGTTDFDTGYDPQYWWFDVNWAVGASPWHIAENLDSTKFYAKYKHEYDAAPLTYTNKMACWCITDNDVVTETNLIESAHEVPPNTVGGAVRPGFGGQFGATQAVQYTGTQYEFAFSYRTGVYSTGKQLWESPAQTPGSPDTQFAPFGFSLYSDGGAGGTYDGMHIIIVPAGTEVELLNTSGTPTTYNGGLTGVLLVAKGLILDPYNDAAAPRLDVVYEIGAMYDTTALSFEPEEEYFIRIEYWPESKPLKYLELDNNTDPNLDRRIRIWLSTDKKQLHAPASFVGEYAMIEYSYISAMNFIALFNLNFHSTISGDPPVTTAYWPTLHMWDEVVCGSAWLPYGAMTVDCKKSDAFTKCNIMYDKTENELTHNAADPTHHTPNFFTTDRAFNQIEVFSRCEVIPPAEEVWYKSDFNVAFNDGWTPNITTGTLQQETTPITGFEDQFNESYTNKGNDPDWTVSLGTWDTNTTAGSLWSAAGAQATIYCTGDVDNDFVFDTEFTITFASGHRVYFFFGVAGAPAAGDFYVSVDVNSIDLIEYRPALTPIASYATIPTGTHTLRVIRAKAFIKVYLDDVLIIYEGVANTVCSSSRFTVHKEADDSVLLDYVTISQIFPAGYASMTNGVDTSTEGDIHRSIAADSDSGFVEFIAWEHFDEGGDDGEWFVKLHYDNLAGGTNYLGLKFTYAEATGTKALTLYHEDGTSKEIDLPTDPPIVNGYTGHHYQIWWNVSAGNITQVSVYSGEDGEFLGSYDGITEPYPGNMRVEMEWENEDGQEPAYYGMVQFTETGDPDLVTVEVPVFHGQVRHIVPSDENGLYAIKALPMDYPLRMRKTFSTGPVVYFPDSDTDEETLLKRFLKENGDDYWRWVHWWNFEITKLPATWIPHRIRGHSAWDIFKAVAEYSGLNWQVTPEQQFLFTDYYRDLYTVDELELSLTPPQGLYLDGSSLAYWNKTQTNWITAANRVDDNTLNKRVGETNLHAADFDWGADLTDQVWNTVAVGHQVPSMTQFDPRVVTGNLDPNEGYASQDIIRATVGADDTAAANVQAFYDTWGASIMSSYSHKNELYKIELLGSKQWFRPMDLIEVKMGMLDATLENVATDIYNEKYVIHSAKHVCHENKVEYVVGRLEVEDDGGDVIVIDGYGDTRTPSSRLKRMYDTGWTALSSTLQ